MDLEMHLEQLVAEQRRRRQRSRRRQQQQGETNKNRSEHEQGRRASGSSSDSGDGSGDGGMCSRRKRAKQFIGLNWSNRVTIILVGTCLLFSAFFALEFLIAKVSTILCQSAIIQLEAPLFDAAESAPKCHLPNPLLDFDQMITCKITQKPLGEEKKPKREATNFELVFEDELQVSSDGERYELGSSSWPISAHWRLSRLLEAHQAAMPFDPDIWRHSEPADQMHLLWGNLSQCSLELAHLLQRLADPPKSGLEKQRLQQLLDSFGRPESGALLAHPFWLGSYLQCEQLNRERWPPQTRRLETRYCVGKVVMNSWLPIQGQPAKPGEADQSQQSQESVSFKVGLCLPKSCDSLALFRQKQRQQIMMNGHDSLTGHGKRNEIENPIESVRKQVELLMRFNFNPNKQHGMNLFAADELKLNDIYCLPLEESRKLSFSAFALLFALCLWLSACVLCTWLRRLPSERRPTNWLPGACLDERLLEIMAIDANLERFLALDRPGFESAAKQEQSEQVVNLAVLDSVKHLGCIGVIGAHVFLTHLTLGTAYSHIIEHIGKDMRAMLLLSLNNTVDTFFVISGLLAAFIMFKKLDRLAGAGSNSRATSSSSSSNLEPNSNGIGKGTKNSIDDHHHRGGRAKQALLAAALAGSAPLTRMVAARYLRMAPLYFLVYAATKSLATHLGSGPLWDYATNGRSLRGLCQRESWLWPLGFLSNFKPIAHHCVPPAWSLAVDLQLCLVTPLLLLALKRWPRRWSYALIGALVCLSSWSTFRDYKRLLIDDSSPLSAADFAKLRLHAFTVLIKHSARGYSRPQNRMGPILIGLLGGHLLHLYELRCLEKRRLARDSKRPTKVDDPTTDWPRYMRGTCFKLILLAGLVFACAPAFVRLREEARTEQIAGAQGGPSIRRILSAWLARANTSSTFDCYLTLAGFVLIKPLWALCNLLLFLRLATDLRHSLLARLMSLSGWRTLSKLNYAMLLVHFELIAYEAMSRYAQTPVTWLDLLAKFCFAYLSSLLLGLLLHTLLELPAHRLTAWLLLGQPPSSSSSSASSSSSSAATPAAAAAAAADTAGPADSESCRQQKAPLRERAECGSCAKDGNGTERNSSPPRNATRAPSN